MVGLDLAQVTQIVDELSQLCGAFEIAAKKNERPRFERAETSRLFPPSSSFPGTPVMISCPTESAFIARKMNAQPVSGKRPVSFGFAGEV